jgi:hypothetical protein
MVGGHTLTRSPGANKIRQSADSKQIDAPHDNAIAISGSRVDIAIANCGVSRALQTEKIG